MAPRARRNNKRKNVRNRKRATRRPAQRKFMLSKPSRKTVGQLSNILETKKFQGIVPNDAKDGWLPYKIITSHIDDVVTSIPIDSFWSMRYASDVVDTNSEASQHCLEGSSLFCKYLQVKLQLDYPDGVYAPSQTPRPIELVWGFTHPFNYTEYTTPRLDEVTQAQLADRVFNTVKNEFNNQSDPMVFHDKKKRLYNVIGRKKIIPKFNRQVPNMTTYLASAAKILTTIKFPMMKKVEYTTSYNNVNDRDALGSRFAYPNQAYVPFLLVVNPDNSFYQVPAGAEDPNLYKPEIKFNDCMWFNDA